MTFGIAGALFRNSPSIMYAERIKAIPAVMMKASRTYKHHSQYSEALFGQVILRQLTPAPATPASVKVESAACVQLEVMLNILTATRT